MVFDKKQKIRLIFFHQFRLTIQNNVTEYMFFYMDKINFKIRRINCQITTYLYFLVELIVDRKSIYQTNQFN